VEARPPRAERRPVVTGAPHAPDASDPAAFIAAFDCSRTLQVGFGDVATTLAVARAHQLRGDGGHTVVAGEGEGTAVSDVVETLRRAGLLAYVEVIADSSELALPQLLRDGFETEFALIHGGKRFEELFVEFVYLDRLLVTGGIMALAGARHRAVIAVLEFITGARAYELRSSPGAELAVLRKMGRHRARHELAPHWSANGNGPLFAYGDATEVDLKAPAALAPSATRELYLERAGAQELELRVAELGTSLLDAEQRASDLSLLRDALDDAEHRLVLSEAAHERAEHWLACMKGSASWRLTAPLRAAKALLAR
jgi:hypothetical protein